MGDPSDKRTHRRRHACDYRASSLILATAVALSGCALETHGNDQNEAARSAHALRIGTLQTARAVLSETFGPNPWEILGLASEQDLNEMLTNEIHLWGNRQNPLRYGWDFEINTSQGTPPSDTRSPLDVYDLYGPDALAVSEHRPLDAWRHLTRTERNDVFFEWIHVYKTGTTEPRLVQHVDPWLPAQLHFESYDPQELELRSDGPHETLGSWLSQVDYVDKKFPFFSFHGHTTADFMEDETTPYTRKLSAWIQIAAVYNVIKLWQTNETNVNKSDLSAYGAETPRFDAVVLERRAGSRDHLKNSVMSRVINIHGNNHYVDDCKAGRSLMGIEIRAPRDIKWLARSMVRLSVFLHRPKDEMAIENRAFYPIEPETVHTIISETAQAFAQSNDQDFTYFRDFMLVPYHEQGLRKIGNVVAGYPLVHWELLPCFRENYAARAQIVLARNKYIEALKDLVSRYRKIAANNPNASHNDLPRLLETLRSSIHAWAKQFPLAEM